MREDIIGYVLSGSTSRFAKMQATVQWEHRIREGMLVKIEGVKLPLLARITQIKHIHEFLEEGDIWSEARKRGLVIPLEAARSYTIAGLEILGEIASGSLQTPEQPPRPGAKVYPFDKRDLLNVIGLGETLVNERLDEAICTDIGGNPKVLIPFASMYGYEDLPVMLDLDALTMHIAIVGTTGSGKSNTTGYLFEKLSKIRSGGDFLGVPIIVFDANGDYLDYVDCEARRFLPGHSKVVRYVISGQNEGALIPPLCMDYVEIRNTLIDLNVFTPHELAELIIHYYKRGIREDTGLQQSLLSAILSAVREADSDVDFSKLVHDGGLQLIIQALRELKKKRSTGLGAASEIPKPLQELKNRRILTQKGVVDLEKMLERIARTAHSATLDAVQRAVEKFYEDLVKRFKIIPRDRQDASIKSRTIDEFTDPQRPHFVVFDFSADGSPGVTLDVKQIIVYYVAKLVYSKFVEHKINNEQRLLLLAIEEAQNYAPNTYTYPIGFSIARDVLATIATQGRKFGVSLCIVTQRPSYVDPIIMSMVNTYIIHRVSHADIDFVLRVTGGLPRYLVSKLPLLQRGVAIVSGQMLYGLSFPVIVRIPKRNTPHRAGTFTIASILS